MVGSAVRVGLRLAAVLATWPFVYVADRLRGVDPPASLRAGIRWARRPLGVRARRRPMARRTAAHLAFLGGLLLGNLWGQDAAYGLLPWWLRVPLSVLAMVVAGRLVDRWAARADRDDCAMPLPDDPDRREFLEWATEHAGVPGRAGPVLQPAGSDERFARARLAYWRQHHPHVPTRLFNRRAHLVHEDWREVADDA